MLTVHVRRAAAMTAVLVVTLGLLLGGSAGAATWAGGWNYRTGVICPDGNPLAAWTTVAGEAFSLDPLSVANQIDDHPPSAADLDVAATPFPSGYHGISAATANVLAALVDVYGSSSDPTTVATVAALIESAGGYPAAEKCVPAGTANSLFAAAQQDIGPYKLTASVDGKVAVGSPLTVHAAVTSAAGAPIAGRTVTFALPGATAASAVTGTDGQATTTLTVGALPAGPTLALTATTADAATPLVRTAENTVAAFQIAPGAPITANSLVTVDQSATPAVGVALGGPIARTGVEVDGSLHISGLRGHSADASAAIIGPLAAGAHASCAGISTAVAHSAAAKHTVSTTTLAVIGDVSTTTPPITATAPGCYALDVTLTTTNATPQAKAEGIAVFSAVSVAAPTLKSVSSPGALAASLGTSPTAPDSISVDGDVRGPLLPKAGSCAGLAWNKAKSVGSVHGSTASGSLNLTGATLPSPGCYATSLDVRYSYSGLGEVAQQLSAGDAGTTTLVLTPALAVVNPTGSADLGHPIPQRVAVYGTFTQPGRLTATTYRLPATPYGCAAADWRHAVVAGPPNVVTTHGDDVYPVSAAVADRGACYSVALTLVLSANSAVVARQPVGVADGLVLVGDPAPAPFDTSVPVVHHSDVWAIVAAVLSGLALLGVALFVGRLAWLARNKPDLSGTPTFRL